MRVLAAIANHGTKNQSYLQVLLDSYRDMRFDVDVVVLSDLPKDLGPDVEVLVGAPTKDPWSLPFAHRALFAARVNDYDLFIYSEDDTPLREDQIDAFLQVNSLLPDHQVPGFQRYELDGEGQRTISSLHSTYRWLPGTVSIHGGETFAAHTNLHAALYVLTRDQLLRAIGSGGFLVEPHADMFDMLVSAAIDPYVQCGLERRLCVSRIEGFLLHHLPNAYVGRLGATEEEFAAQIDSLLRIGVGASSAAELLDPSSRLPTHVWDIIQYPQPEPLLRELAPAEPGHVLSVGATSGAAEVDAFPDARRITAVPIDAVIGAVAATRGIDVLPPDLDELERRVEAGSVDTVVLHHNLHHVRHPASLLRRLGRVAREDAIVLVGMQNTPYHRLRELTGRRLAAPTPRRDYDSDGIHRPGVAFLHQLERTGVVTWDAIRLTRSDRLARWRYPLPAAAASILGREVYARGRLRR